MNGDELVIERCKNAHLKWKDGSELHSGKFHYPNPCTGNPTTSGLSMITTKFHSQGQLEDRIVMYKSVYIYILACQIWGE